MANKKTKRVKGQGINRVIDPIVQKLLISIDPDRSTITNISDKQSEFNDIINEQLERAKGISDGNIVDFSRGLMSNINKETGKKIDSESLTVDIIDHINKNPTSIVQEFSDNERNRYIELRDYNFITSFVPKITQAIRLILTHIVSSDDLSGQVTRNIELGSSISDTDKDTLMQALTKYEEKTKLLGKLKNIVYRNTLIMGTYYVYAKPYKELFKEYDQLLQTRRKEVQNITSKMSGAKEAVDIPTFACESLSCTEFEVKTFKDEIKAADIFDNFKPKTNPATNMDIDASFGDVSTVSVIESAVPFFLQDDEGISDEDTLHAAMEAVGYDYSAAMESSTTSTTDATKDPNDKAYNVSGLYIKFISCRNVIPVEILGNRLGYFYMISNTVDKSKQALSITNNYITTNKKQSPLQAIAKSLTEKIAQKFSSKFVAENAQFKQLIADCIIATGVTNTEYKIQFIPAADMIEFTVNEDESGHGRSILADAKYPAKTLAAISMRKTLNYINNSGDKTVMTLRGGVADVSKKNQAMQIIRNMQESNVVVSDIIGDFNNVFHKYSANGYILMPTSRSGNKLVELEKLEGQQISMDVEWEKEKSDETLISIGTPPLIIEQYQQADFAKSITSAHAGFAGIIINYQSDLEGPTSRLYERIIETLDIPQSIKTNVNHSCKFKLPRPKSSSTQTGLDALQNALQFAEAYTNLKYGDSPDESLVDVVRELKFKIVREQASCIDFSHYDDLAKLIEAKYIKIKDEVKDTDASISTDDGSDTDMSF